MNQALATKPEPGSGLIRCRKCVIPNTRPDTEFVDGVCSACIAYEKRAQIDWDERKRQLEQLLDRFHGECIVPSSGGKDSTYQAVTLKAMGADVTVVTATTCHLTVYGRYNIDNLKRHCRTVEYSPDMTQRAKLNRLGLEMVGDISWPEHVSIFTTPFRAAVDLRKKLIFYGENPQNQYGGPMGSEEALQMTKRWRSEFGGFLGLRPSDMEPMAGKMSDYMLPPDEALAGVEAHFLGQYIAWDSRRNLDVAREAGMLQPLPTSANWWSGENVDNAQTGLHDHMMYRKFGYGRGAAQIAVDIRAGRITRRLGLEWVREYDGLFPFIYADVTLREVLERIGVKHMQLVDILNQFTNWALFDGEFGRRPLLKEAADGGEVR